MFARQILDDPALDGVAGVLFDEFHERSLDADLGLALALDAQAALRDDLRLLVMSATLDGARVRALLGDAPLIESQGRAFPVVTRYVGRDRHARIEDEVARATLEALDRETGSALVFLPGQGEIRRVAETLEARIRRPDVDVAPLYGALDPRAQDRAVEPAPPGRRKIVLATSIAETSLTIEGVRIVIDSGLMRVPRYEPDIGLTRLETVRVSRANADQRRGRAGRVEPGVCVRLWEEAATGGLQAYAAPEILTADLSGFLLDCAVWGETDPTRLAFLDPPPRAALNEARALLGAIGALDADGRVTGEGRAIARLALPPRLARMVVDAARSGEARTAAEVAVILTERGLGGDAVDLATRLDAFRRDRSPRAEDARRLARGLAQRAAEALTPDPSPRGRGEREPFSRLREKSLPPGEDPGVAGESRPDEGTGALLASAYPDRIAVARGKRGEFLMANGRAAALEAHDPLAGEAYLAIGEVVGRAAAARILIAAPLSLAEIEAAAGGAIETADEVAFDRASASLRARRRRRLGALTLVEQTLAVPADEAKRDGARPRRPGARRRPAAVEPGADPMARPGELPPARRGRRVAGPVGRAASRRSGMARAVPYRQDAARRDRRGRSRERAPRPAAVGPRAPARRRGADPFCGADRHSGRDRLRGRGRAVDRAEGAGAVRPRRASRGRGRQDPADAASPVAGPPADPDHPRSARLLARLLGRGALGPARPLPAPLLAGGPGERRADRPRQAAGTSKRRRHRQEKRLSRGEQRSGRPVVKACAPTVTNNWQSHAAITLSAIISLSRAGRSYSAAGVQSAGWRGTVR